MKFYVWHNVLTDYTDGVIFALASSPEEARKVARQSDDAWEGGQVWKDTEAEPTEYAKPIGFAVWGGG